MDFLDIVVSKVEHHYSLGDSCYALYFGPRRDRDPRWVPAIVTKVHGTRSVNVRVIPRGPTWRRHLDQLRPLYGSDQDDDPCEIPSSSPLLPVVSLHKYTGLLKNNN